jgi:hypothetical protein
LRPRRDDAHRVACLISFDCFFNSIIAQNGLPLRM